MKAYSNVCRVGGSVLFNRSTITFKYTYHTVIDFIGDYFIDKDKIVRGYSMVDEDYGMLEVWLSCLQRKLDDLFYTRGNDIYSK